MKKIILLLLPLLFLAGCTPAEEAENLERALDTTAESMGHGDFDFEVRDVVNPDISITTPEFTINLNEDTMAALEDFEQNVLPELQRREREYKEREAAKVPLPKECPFNNVSAVERHCSVVHPIRLVDEKRDTSYLCKVTPELQRPTIEDFSSEGFSYSVGDLIFVYVDRWTGDYRRFFIDREGTTVMDVTGLGDDAFLTTKVPDAATKPRNELTNFELVVNKGGIAYRFKPLSVSDKAGRSSCNVDQMIELAKDWLD